ncbi:MAG: FAD-dependent oxidoreductase [Desulfotomaculum sp.]|nr:FAD-dependent oxidoreductase [Desulfotomaculum sp.]
MKRYLVLAVVVLIIGLGWFYLGKDPQPQPLIVEPPDKPAVQALDYDLIVVGSDPEGIAAAVSGARNGLNTLLVDTRPVLGGLMTLGWLNTIDMNFCPAGEILNKGIFLEFFEQVEGDSFDVNTALRVFNQLVENEPNLSVLLNVADMEPLVELAITTETASKPITVKGVKVTGAAGEIREFTAPVVIDATQDADIAAAAGVPYSITKEDFGHIDRFVAVTLVFKLAGVSNLDWYRMGVSLAGERVSGFHAGINPVSAWGFGQVMAEYQPTNEQVSMRGLNIGRQNDGTLLINALHVFGINPLDPQQLQEARRLAEAELPYIIKFLQQNIPGLSDAELVAVAPELYVRESRHIFAEYRLTIDDVLENRDFPDAIAYGSYPVDVQAVDRYFAGTVVGFPAQYAIPFRSLVPLEVDGLLVVGRSAGFDSLPHGSARVIPIGMATGQAAGAAAALAMENNISVRQLSANSQLISVLQQRLNQQGMKIAPFEFLAPETLHWSYAGLRFVRSYGLACGGYENEYHLDQEITEERFINVLSTLTKLAGQTDLSRPKLSVEGNALTVDDIAYMFTRYLGMELNQSQAYQYLMAENFFDEAVMEKIATNERIITRGATYMLLEDFIIYANNQSGQ